MGSRLLLNLLARRHPRREQGAISAAAGIVATVVLILSGAAVVQLSSGNLRGVFASSDTRQARAAAEEGADLMIDTWNQPQNRALLVSGADPAGWDSDDDLLRSPCIDSDASRPGGNGRPTQAAIDLGDGEWRDAVTGEQRDPDEDGRHFRLIRIDYTASDGSAAPNPRALRRSVATIGGGASGATPPDDGWRTLVNLNDPDGATNPLPRGRNSGFIILGVEGRVVRGGRVVANSRETLEFEVLPKCCGASLGSQGSGGINFPAGQPGSLGSDSRFCGLDFGVITGFNEGWHWSYFANDRFTSRIDDGTPDGEIVDLISMLGAVPDGVNVYNRSNCRVRPAVGCPRTDSPGDDLPGDDPSFASNIAGADPDDDAPPCRQPAGTSGYYPGGQPDIDGEAASCVPIVPVRLGSIPLVADNYAFNWTDTWGPDSIIDAAEATADKDDNIALWPRLSTDDGSFGSSDYILRLRTNLVAQSVELCMVDRDGSLGTEDCNEDTWLNITSTRQRPAGCYGAGTPLGAGCGLAIGNIQTSGGNPNPLLLSAAFEEEVDGQDTAFTQGDFNLNALEAPYLTVRLSRSNNWETSDSLIIEASPDDGASWYSLTNSPLRRGDINTSTTGTTFTLGLPFSGDDVAIRFRSGNNWFDEEVIIRDLRVESGRVRDDDSDVVIISRSSESAYPIFGAAWCEYSPSSPRTNAPGFHCLGPTFDQTDGGQIIVDTTTAPLSFYYTESATTDRRNGPNTDNRNFIYLSGTSAQFRHVQCPATGLSSNCITPIPDNLFSAVGQPTALNFFGRDAGTANDRQNIKINTDFGADTRIGGVWFYMPNGSVLLRVNSGAALIPPNFYNDNPPFDNQWTYSGRIWVSEFKPYGAFHLRVPPGQLDDPTGLFGQVEVPSGGFVTWQGNDWVARAVTSKRLW